jgi:hypothetical protein
MTGFISTATAIIAACRACRCRSIIRSIFAVAGHGVSRKPPRGLQVKEEKRDPRDNFRFFENRQNYPLFVHTCSEKRVVAERIGLELSSIHPKPPALRVFDAGVGDGTVLARVMRLMHGRFPAMPFYIAGKGAQPRGCPADPGKGRRPPS